MTTISRSLDLVTPTLRDVSGWMKVPYNTVRSWKLGNRAPPPDVQRQLARALRKHGNRVLKAADQLDRHTRRQEEQE